MKTSLLLVVLFFVVAPNVAAATDTNGDGYITVLVPIAFSPNQVLPGAYGTQWTGELWAHNASGVNIDSIQPDYCSVPIVCPIIAFPAGFAGIWSPVVSNHHDGGALFFLPASTADEIHLSARLLELTRRAQPAGVQIPVVREDSFFTKPTEYLGIPVSSGLRSALRVYDPRIQRGSSVRVEILNPTGTAIGATVISPGNDDVVPDVLPQVPHWHPWPGAVAIHNLSEAFPQVKAYSHFHVRVTPLISGIEYWAMVSVTDNEAQHVLLITAH